MTSLKTLIISLIFLGVFSCIKPPDYPDIPAITLEGFSSDTMIQGDLNNDSILLLISFTDGDGDIGSDDSVDVFLTDLRDGFLANRYRLPPVPEPGRNNGISGEITLTLFTTCCVYPNGQPPCTPSNQFPTDQVQYEIYIVDQAGNESNRIQTPSITLLCNAQ